MNMDRLCWGGITCTLSVFSFENPSPPRTHITWQFSMNAHCTIRPSPQLIAIPDVLLCCKCSRYIIKPALPRKSKYIFIIMLLLMSGIESIPGPVSPSSQQLQLGLVNARSIVNKAALIHDAIHDHMLDLLAVTETWVYEDSPNVIKQEAAPTGFSITHAHGSTSIEIGRASCRERV